MSESEQFEISKIFLHAWSLEKEENIEFHQRYFLEFCLDYGLLSAWQYSRNFLYLNDKLIPDSQIELAEKISSEKIILINQLLDASEDRCIKDDLRLIGLTTSAISQNPGIIKDLLPRLKIQSEAIDLMPFISLHGRSITTSTLINQGLCEGGIINSSLQSLQEYYKLTTSCIYSQVSDINNEGLFIINSSYEMRDLLEGLCNIAKLIHKYRFDEATELCKLHMKNLPSCPELLWINHYLELQSNKGSKLSNVSRYQDPLLLYRYDSYNFTEIDSLVVLQQSEKSQDLAELIRSMTGWGLDPEIADIANQYLINSSHYRSKFTEGEERIISRAENISSTSDYDPFEITLLSQHIKDSKSSSVKILPDNDESTLQMNFVIGHPSPLFGIIHRALTDTETVGVLPMKSYENGIIDPLVTKNSTDYIEEINNIKEYDIRNSRLMYEYHIASCFGGQDLDSIYEISPMLFKNIGLVYRLYPNANIVVLHPPIETSIIASFCSIGGYSSSHCVATISELIAYYYDYIDIVLSWSKLTDKKFKNIRIMQHSNIYSTDVLSSILPKAAIMPTYYKSSLEYLDEIKSYYPRIASQINEFSEELDYIDKTIQTLCCS